jgi:hypothetical protein
VASTTISSPSTVNEIFMTSSSTPFSIYSITSSVATQTTSYSSSLSSILKTGSFTQIRSRATKTGRGTTLLSNLLTTSSSLISNQPTRKGHAITSMPLTTQINSNLTNITGE